MAMRSIYNKYKYKVFHNKEGEIFTTFSDSDYSIFINPNVPNFNEHLVRWRKLSCVILHILRGYINVPNRKCFYVHTTQDHVHVLQKGRYIAQPIMMSQDFSGPLPISIHELQTNPCIFNKEGILIKLQFMSCTDKSGTKCTECTNFNELVDIVIRNKDDASLIEDYTDIYKIIKTYNYNRQFSFTTYSFDGYINDIIHID